MNFYLDTEFIEGTQKSFFGQSQPTIDLISIGIVSESGHKYYAVSKEFNLKEAWNRWQQRTGEGDRNNKEPRLYWIRENVLKPIFEEWVKEDSHWTNKDLTLGKWKFTYNNFKYFLEKNGQSRKKIASFIDSWVDHILYNGYIVKRPIRFYAYYADYDWVAFCWLFGKMIDLPKGFPKFCMDLKQMMVERGFDGDWKKRFCPDPEGEHNALVDATWNKKLHKMIKIADINKGVEV
jgi:hypothetical protein